MASGANDGSRDDVSRVGTEMKQCGRNARVRWGIAMCAIVLLTSAGCATGPLGAPAETAALPTTTGATTPGSAPPSVSPLSTPTPVPETSSPGRASADVVLASWLADGSGVSASAYVAGVLEDAGTCTLHVRLGEQELTATRSGRATGQNTSCGLIEIPAERLSDGQWELWIDYSSARTAGESGHVTVDVEGTR